MNTCTTCTICLIANGESDEGTVKFLKLLTKHKAAFPRKGSYDGVLEKIRRLLVKHMIKANLATVRECREHLRNKYTKCKRKGKSNIKHFAAMDVAFGDALISTLRGSAYDSTADHDLEFDEERPAPFPPGSGRTGSYTKIFIKLCSCFI